MGKIIIGGCLLILVGIYISIHLFLYGECVSDITDMVDYDPVTQTSARCEQRKQLRTKFEGVMSTPSLLLGNVMTSYSKLELLGLGIALCGCFITFKYLRGAGPQEEQQKADLQEADGEYEMQALHLQAKCNKIEEKLLEEQGKLTEKDDELGQLREDMASLEADLVTANEERQKLCNNLHLVESELKHIRMELVASHIKGQQLQEQLNDQEIQVDGKGEELRQLSRDNAALVTAKELLHKLRGDTDRVESLQMQQELDEKTSHLESSQMEGQQLKEQLRDQEEQVEVQQAKLDAELQTAKDSYERSMHANSGLQVELSMAREEFRMLEQKLQEALTENANLCGQVESLSEDQQQLSGLLDKNASLRQQVVDMQSSMGQELAEQKAKVVRLDTELSQLKKELQEKKHTIQALKANRKVLVDHPTDEPSPTYPY